MKKTLIVAAAMLLGTASFAGAAENGASNMSPGHEMQKSTTHTRKGASEYSPGDKMQDKGTTGMSRSSSKGATQYSPGSRMNKQKKY